LQNLTGPSANLSLNNFLITNLASGTIASGNTSSVTGGNVYDYIATLPSVITQQVYTVTVNGSSTNGFLFTAFTNTPQNNTVQCQRVKGSGAQMITSSVITSQSQTLVPDYATLQFQVANANIRVTQVVPYTTTAFTAPGQQNIASMTFSQQAISSTATCIQLYKPVSNQGGATFILYVYVDQF
jgi:hypothetical protein